ncbi:MAG: aminopeptidase P family protein, partial [Planctomycetota bacterium]
MNTQHLFRARRQRLLAAIGSDATLWFAHPDTLRYLAGFHVDPFSLGHGFGGVLALKTDGSTTLWYDDRLPDSVGAACVDQAIIVPWYDGITPARGLRSQAVLNHLPNEWPGCFHDFPGQSDRLFNSVEILANLRRCKDEHEIAVLEQCCRAGEAGHAWARAHLEPGMTELQLYAGINRACTLAAGQAVIVYGDFAVSPG